MLTPQPSPRQLWVAFRDRAWHFDWDEARRSWMDDRGQGVELYGLIEETTHATGGVGNVQIRAAKCRGTRTARPFDSTGPTGASSQRAFSE